MKVSQNCVIRNSFHVLSNDPRSILNSNITVHSKLSIPDCSNADAIESRIPLIIDIYNSQTLPNTSTCILSTDEIDYILQEICTN